MGITVSFTEKNYGGIYLMICTRNIRKILNENIDVFFNEKLCPKSILIDKDKIIQDIQNAKLVTKFDNSYTTRFLELENANEYYENSGLKDLFANVSKPFLSVFTIDDHIIHFETVPLKTMENNKNMVTLVNNNGRHIAFFSGLIPKRWISLPVKTFMNHILTYLKKMFIEF
jgi:predicted alpha/beta-fold hydrolase